MLEPFIQDQLLQRGLYVRFANSRSEQSLLPVHLLGLVPFHVDRQEKSTDSLVIPDYIINVPYKVMGAKPNQEKGEGVIMEFSPNTLILGTDGYVSKGEFIHLSFIIPRTKEEFVVMAQVIEKRFEGDSSKVTLKMINMDERHRNLIQQYYNRVLKK